MDRGLAVNQKSLVDPLSSILRSSTNRKETPTMSFLIGLILGVYLSQLLALLLYKESIMSLAQKVFMGSPSVVVAAGVALLFLLLPFYNAYHFLTGRRYEL